MKLFTILPHLVLAACIGLPSMANANVVPPLLDIQNLTFAATEDGLDDLGASISSSAFSIDATAFAIITNGGTVDISNVSFSLTTTSGSFTAGNSGSFAGSIIVGSGLLTGTFTDLQVFDLGAGMLQYLGDVSYTGGSLATGLAGGRFEGIASGSDVVAKLGTVVPVPAAVWLFVSGMIGLLAVARRKKSIA